MTGPFVAHGEQGAADSAICVALGAQVDDFAGQFINPLDDLRVAGPEGGVQTLGGRYAKTVGLGQPPARLDLRSGGD